MENYFIINNSDGDTTVKTVSKEELLEDLDNGDYGENPIFLDSIPQSDTNYWGEKGYLIIKGSIVTPNAKQVITKHEIT